MRRITTVAILLGLAGPVLAQDQGSPLSPPVEACKADAATGFIGKRATPKNMARIRRATGAKAIRILKPNMAVTMEYMFGRTNVLVNERNVIQRISCG